MLCFCIFAVFAMQIEMCKRKGPCTCTRIPKDQMRHKSEGVAGSWETNHQRCGPNLCCLLVFFIHWWLDALEMLGQLAIKCTFGKQHAKRPCRNTTKSNRGICEWLALLITDTPTEWRPDRHDPNNRRTEYVPQLLKHKMPMTSPNRRILGNFPNGDWEK